MEELNCPKCGDIKPITEFNKDRRWCKRCKKEYCKEYYHKNKDKILKQKKDYRCGNIEHYRKKYVYTGTYFRFKWSTDPLFRELINIRSLTYSCVKQHNKMSHINSKAVQLLGCDHKTLMNHLQISGLRYDPLFDIYNYDSTKYQIDHIKTFSDFKKGKYNLNEICNYTNLQILPKHINLSKGCNSW